MGEQGRQLRTRRAEDVIFAGGKGKAAAAGAVGFIRCTASVGGFVGPYIVGELSQRSDSFSSGFAVAREPRDPETDADIAEVEVAPKMEGYQMFTIFIPKKSKAEVKKAAVHVSQAPDAAEPQPEKKKEKTERVKPAEETLPEDDLIDGIF